MGTGLRLMQFGAQLIGWALASAFAIGCGGAAVVSGLELGQFAGWVVSGLFITALGTAAVGRLLCAAGRWVCLASPPEAPAARARIRLVVVLETCGILSGITTLGLACSGIPIPSELGLAGFGLSVLSIVLARVFFFHFVQAVAEGIPTDTTATSARRLFRISLVAIGAVVVGVMLFPLGSSIPAEEAIRQRVCGCFYAVGGLSVSLALFLGLYLLAGHFMLLADLRREVADYTPPPADDDPDRPYLERYSASDDPDG